MGNYLVLREDVVTNIVEATPEVAAEMGLLAAGQAQIGWRLIDGVLTPPSRDIEAEWRVVCVERDRRLKEDVDVINAVRWQAMNETTQKAWNDYRQALLDLPESVSDPRDVVWPVMPGGTTKRLGRRRWSDGTYRADDPATPAVNEAWIEAKS
jgi:hypothetical protein